MSQAANAGTIGISVRDTALRMTECCAEEGGNRITRISQGRVRTAFRMTSVQNQALVRQYAEDLNRLYESGSFQGKQAVFTLDSNMVLLKKIPVDASLKGQSLKDHIYWEVEQCVINPLSEYVVAYESLGTGKSRGTTEMAAVIVRRAMVDFLKEIFNFTVLSLGAIDVDVFAAHRVFLAAHGGLPNDRFSAMIDVRKNDLQFSIVKAEEFVLCQEVDYSLDGSSLYSEPDNDYRSKFLFKELRRIILDNKLGSGVEDMAVIYIYGESIDDSLVKALASSQEVRVDRANPFQKIKTGPQAGNLSSRKHPEAFVVSVGAALKGLK